jgi:hypothetical protein
MPFPPGSLWAVAMLESPHSSIELWDRRAIVGGEPGIARGRMLDGNMKIERDVTVRLGGRTLEEGPNICVKQRRDRAAWRFLR